MGSKIREGPDYFGGVTAGLLLILFVILVVITPTIFANFLNFITDFALIEVYPGFFWWAPQNPSTHLSVYNVFFQFFMGTIVINIIVLMLRVIFRDSYRRQIESIGGIVFSVGVTWAANNLILNNNFTTFAGYLIVFGGVSIIISSLAYWAVRQYTA